MSTALFSLLIMSNTPETDALIKTDAHHGIDGYMSETAYDRMSDLCLKMEWERNEARNAAEVFREMAEQTFKTLPFPRRFHWENSQAHPPR